MLELLIVLGAGYAIWTIYQRGQTTAGTASPLRLPTYTTPVDTSRAQPGDAGVGASLDEWMRRLGVSTGWEQGTGGTPYQAPPVGWWNTGGGGDDSGGWTDSGGSPVVGGSGGDSNTGTTTVLPCPMMWVGGRCVDAGGVPFLPPGENEVYGPPTGGVSGGGESLVRDYVSSTGSRLAGWYVNSDTVVLRGVNRTAAGGSVSPDLNVPPGNTIIALKNRGGSEYAAVAMMPTTPAGFKLYIGTANLGSPSLTVTMPAGGRSAFNFYFTPEAATVGSVLHGQGESSAFQQDVAFASGQRFLAASEMLLGVEVGMRLRDLAAPPPSRTGQAYRPYFVAVTGDPYDRAVVAWARTTEITPVV